MATTALSGVQLIRAADLLLDRSARTFTRAGAPPDASAAPSDDDLAGAATDVLVARRTHQLGIALLRADREQTRALLDVVA